MINAAEMNVAQIRATEWPGFFSIEQATYEVRGAYLRGKLTFEESQARAWALWQCEVELKAKRAQAAR